MKVGVGALHRGIGKTKQNANKKVAYSRENCGVVDRREIDGKKMERTPRLEKKINHGRNVTSVRKCQLAKGVARPSLNLEKDSGGMTCAEGAEG